MKLGLWGGVILSDERETKSFGVSGRSGERSRSQESEAGVRGRGLQGCCAGLPGKRPWLQEELMHTKASAASRSVYSRLGEPPLVPLEKDCSLPCLLLFK